jgi:N-acetylmuramoyl-L-alanine amidase
VIDKVSVTLNSSNQTVIKIATTKLQGYELAADDNNLYVNIGDPKEIYKNIVLLDPGHGGSANGAQYYGTKEKDVNFAILYTIGRKYFDSDPSKLKVYYTRTSDTNPGLSERAAMTKTYGADLFVSLHMNAADATVVGTEVFYSGKNDLKNSSGLSADKLASIFSASLTNRLGTDSRGVKKEDYTVIYKNSVPAILIELGFLSTKSEHARLTDPTFQENAAKAIYETLLEVFEDYPTGR